MNLLAQVHHGKKIAPRRTLIYGTQGIGKSQFAASSPNAIFISTEDGLGTIDCDSFPVAHSLEEVLQALSELYLEPDHPYQTLVIDSADWLEQLIWTDVCKKRAVESIEDVGYGKGYTFALKQWRDVIDGLEALRNERGMGIVLIAHAKIERFEDPSTDTYDRYVPRLHKTASALLQEFCDEVLFACYRVHATVKDEGFGRKRAQGIGTGERVLRTSERPAHVAKNRLNLPDELPLDWHEYAKHFPSK